jgi:superfamily II DNA/RNA helicase
MPDRALSKNDNVADKFKDFKSVDLSKPMLENLKSLGNLKMTPIQEKGLPFILSNRDFYLR